MSAEQEVDELHPSPPPEDPTAETLTDLIDRMEREAFHRALEKRDLRIFSTTVRFQRSSNSL